MGPSGVVHKDRLPYRTPRPALRPESPAKPVFLLEYPVQPLSLSVFLTAHLFGHARGIPAFRKAAI